MAQPTDQKKQDPEFPWENYDIETIVSIDFGSFGFAAAYCPIGAPEHQRMVENWNDNRAASELNKNLAALLIDKETKETVAMGYEAEEMYTKAQEKKEDDQYMYFEHFKPYLYSTDHLKKNIEVPSADGQSTLPLADLITKSLSAVMEHTIHCINELNKLAGMDEIGKYNIFWVISVPAIWDEMSKEMMKSCSKKAGMRYCELGSEPIVSTFQVLNAQGKDFRLKSQDKIMILDCGGGTIDAACIKINSSSFDLSELHHGDGIRAGGLDVDKEFIKLLEQVLPQDIVNEVKTRQPAQWLRQKNEFVLAKFSCPFLLDEPWNVPFSFGINSKLAKMKKKRRKDYNALKKTIEQHSIDDFEAKYEKKGKTDESKEDQKEAQVSGMVKLGRSNLKIEKKAWLNLHEQVLAQIVAFVQKLFGNGSVNGCNKVIVVGGFANSKYLINRLVAEFPDKTFFTPRSPHLAVVKGALYWICQRKKLKKTRAKYSYGIAIDRRYNPNNDKQERRTVTVDGGAIVENSFNTLVTRDDEYEDGHTAEFDYWIPANANHLEIALYASEDRFCKYVFDMDGNLPSEPGRKCFNVKKFRIDIAEPSTERVQFQIRLVYQQNGIDLHYIDPSDGSEKKVTVDPNIKPGSDNKN